MKILAGLLLGDFKNLLIPPHSVYIPPSDTDLYMVRLLCRFAGNCCFTIYRTSSYGLRFPERYRITTLLTSLYLKWGFHHCDLLNCSFIIETIINAE